MRSVYVYIIGVFFVICLTSCPREEPCSEMEFVSLYISNGQRRIAYPYQYAYGLGRAQQPIHLTGYYQSDTFFNLPLDVNADKSSFVLLRTDGSSDTVQLKYKINYYLEKRCDFRFERSELEVAAVSSRFNKDYSEVRGGYLVIVRLK